MEAKPLPILMYHAIVEDADCESHPIHVTVKAFREQMWWLHEEGYHTLTIDELFKGAATGYGKFCLVTFDDGYCSTREIALPILKEFGFKATLYTCTGSIGAQYEDYPGIVPESLPKNERPLTWEEIKTLSSAGWSVQAHSESHADHSMLSRFELHQEMENSRRILDQNNTPVNHYAYPFGRYNAEAIDTARALGFVSAATVHSGLYKAGTDPFCLPRIEINRNDDLKRFQRKVITGYGSAYQAIKAKIRNRLFSNPFFKDRVRKLAGKLIN